MSPRVSKWPALASIAFLLLAAVGRWSYGFYTLLRFVACGSAIYLAFQASELRRAAWVWFMGATAVLFNPLIPVRLSHSDWQVLDFMAAVVFGISLFTIREKPEYGGGVLRIGNILRWLAGVPEEREPPESVPSVDPDEELAKSAAAFRRPLVSELASRDFTDPRVQDWIDQEYRRAIGVPVETDKPPAPPGTPSRDEEKTLGPALENHPIEGTGRRSPGALSPASRTRLRRSNSSTKTTTGRASTAREPNREAVNAVAITKIRQWLDGELDIGWTNSAICGVLW